MPKAKLESNEELPLKTKLKRLVFKLIANGTKLKRHDPARYQRFIDKLEEYLDVIDEMERLLLIDQVGDVDDIETEPLTDEEDDISDPEPKKDKSEDDDDDEKPEPIKTQLKLKVNSPDKTETNINTNIPLIDPMKEAFSCKLCGGNYHYRNKALHCKSRKHLTAEAKANGMFDFTTGKIVVPKAPQI